MPVLNISGSLKDAYNNPVPNRNIHIYVKLVTEQNYPQNPVLILTTDQNGEFSGNVEIDYGLYDLKAIFFGDERYRGAEAEMKGIDARIGTYIEIYEINIT